MAVFRVESGAYAISSNQCWLPGRYEDERTAKYAFRLPADVLLRLQEERNSDGSCVISFEDLQAAAQKLSAK